MFQVIPNIHFTKKDQNQKYLIFFFWGGVTLLASLDFLMKSDTTLKSFHGDEDDSYELAMNA